MGEFKLGSTVILIEKVLHLLLFPDDGFFLSEMKVMDYRAFNSGIIKIAIPLSA